jgi:uncharacterized membrane protein YbaN (DUF454 family)
LSVISLKSVLPNKSITGEYVLKTLKTVDEVVEFYFSSSSRLRSNIYIILGSVFVFFAIVGIWVPGWPTVSWAVPAAFLFSLSSEKLFRWTLTNEYFGSALFDYYSSGKTLPNHVKRIIALFIISMSLTSSYFVWLVSTKGDGELLVISSWDGADPGFGFITIIFVGLIGVWYVLFQVKSR